MKYNRKKALKHQAKTKRNILKVKDVTKLEYKHVKVWYAEDTDRFWCDIKLRVNKRELSVKGIIMPDQSYIDGVRVLTPQDNRSPTYQKEYDAYELYLSKTDSKYLFACIKAFVDSTGDALDLGIYENVKHGFLEIYNDDKWINEDSDIIKHANWNHNY